jgi:hypothetical protein
MNALRRQLPCRLLAHQAVAASHDGQCAGPDRGHLIVALSRADKARELKGERSRSIVHGEHLNGSARRRAVPGRLK